MTPTPARCPECRHLLSPNWSRCPECGWVVEPGPRVRRYHVQCPACAEMFWSEYKSRHPVIFTSDTARGLQHLFFCPHCQHTWK